MSPDQEILPPRYASKGEARPVIQQAVKHYGEARRATIQVMADIRRLQDAEVHILYGYKNFAHWAVATFDGMAEGNVRQLARCGAVALELDARGLIDLRNPKHVGTGALRELSVIKGDYGEDKMVEIFLTARTMTEPGKDMVERHVKAAMHLLMPPAPEDLPQAVELDPEDENDEPEYPAQIAELIDRCRDLAYDLPESADELAEATKQLQDELSGKSAGQDELWTESAR